MTEPVSVSRAYAIAVLLAVLLVGGAYLLSRTTEQSWVEKSARDCDVRYTGQALIVDC